MRSQDLFHVVFERQLVQLDLLLWDLVLRGEEGLLVDLLKPPLVSLMLLVEAAELIIRLDQLRLELVVLRHTSPPLPVRKVFDEMRKAVRHGPVPANGKRDEECRR